jgi:pimeloyl-ACP methyl ester carboxylesterase
VIHINAPGQEENAANFPDNFTYPTLDELAEQITDVLTFYQITHFIGFGVGVGANILSRFALDNPTLMDGLFLINPTSGAASWSEWLYQKFNVYSLGLSGQSWSLANPFPESTRDYLLWHHFGRVTEERNRDLIQMYRNYFANKAVSPRNLSMFIDVFIKRTDLNLIRNEKRNFTCPVLLLCGALSPHVEESIQMNARLNPATSTWMKLQDCGMVLEEEPGKVTEALKLFIQGLGYSLTAYERRRSSLRKMSVASSSVSSSLSESNRALGLLSEATATMKISENGDVTEETDQVSLDKSAQPEDIRILANPIQC